MPYVFRRDGAVVAVIENIDSLLPRGTWEEVAANNQEYLDFADPSKKSKIDRIRVIEAQNFLTQRSLREAVLVLGEIDARLKATPIYERAALAEALIEPIRRE